MKELKKRKKKLEYFKRYIVKLNSTYNFTFPALKALIDEVASYGETGSGA